MATLAPSTFPVDGTGRVLDRLACLETIFSPSIRRQALLDAGLAQQRRWALTHEVVLGLVLALGLLADSPIRRVFQHSRRFHPDSTTPDRSSLCLARQRLGVAPLRCLFHSVVRPQATPQTPGGFFRGFRTVACDGVVFNVPDSQANAVFGYPGSSRSEAAFPQIRKVSRVETGTHIEFAFTWAGVGQPDSDELTLASRLFKHLRKDMLLLAGSGLRELRLVETGASAGGDALGPLQEELGLAGTQTSGGRIVPLQTLPQFDGS